MSFLLLNLGTTDIVDYKNKAAIVANEGKTLSDNQTAKFKDHEGKEQTIKGSTLSKDLLDRIPAAMQQLEALRTGTKYAAPIDISLGEFIQEKFGYSPTEKKLNLSHGGEQIQLVPESFYAQVGINPNSSTISELNERGNQNEAYRWIIPEIYTDAIRLGMRKSPIYGDLIRGEENVTQLKVNMPAVKMSEMTARKLGEAETIQTGAIEFNMKDVTLQKLGLGISITDEASSYVALNLIAYQLEDFGVLLGQGIDNMAIQTLLNGDQSDGSEGIGVVGVKNGTDLVYRDLLHSWIRMSRMGQLPGVILAGEEVTIDLLEMPEFKGFDGMATKQRLNVKTPLPQNQTVHVHGNIPDNQLMFINPGAAMLKLNAQALKAERARDPKRQLTEIYLTLTTGFATMRRDARLAIDISTGFNSFPDFMDIDKTQRVTIK